MLTLRPVEPNEYRALYKHIERDFPKSERPPYFVVRGNLKKGAHRAHWLMDDGCEAGYTIETAPDGLDFVLINFLAILPDARSGGYGSALLELIARAYPDRSALVEVEDPAAAKDDAARTTCERRIRFYERAGYENVPLRKCHLFGVPMLIMIQGGRRPASMRALLHALYRPTFNADFWLKNVDVEDAL